MSWAEIGPFLVGFGGVVVSVIGAIMTNRSTMRRLDQEKESVIAGAAGVIVVAASKQVEILNGTIEKLSKQIVILEDAQTADRKEIAKVIQALLEVIDELATQIVALGGKPIYKRPKIPSRFKDYI